ncbi:hypothetical protein P2H44_14360 [Albimonas sp. CAU 1670]|uniref:hypothetical protein n=1 Tax=Albimonas sp. CAU 1670 TaxID=3032599 RepID=UPI0023DA00B4|nr:hypothetical protein [Albimonas sp. CAU 1670]MDF2233740.1 hypothetical protein [Albimonas sp. CAU 1670]
MFAELQRTGGEGTALAARARGLNARVMLRADQAETLVVIRGGAVVSVEAGPFVMPSWDVALSAPADEWRRFLEAVPPPGAHDLMALVRRGVMRFEGNLHPLMANLMYFKLLLASLRPRTDGGPAA